MQCIRGTYAERIQDEESRRGTHNELFFFSDSQVATDVRRTYSGRGVPTGPLLRVTARQEQVGSAALSGHPFSLKYVVYASCFSTSAGAWGGCPGAYRVSSRMR